MSTLGTAEEEEPEPSSKGHKEGLVTHPKHHSVNAVGRTTYLVRDALLDQQFAIGVNGKATSGLNAIPRQLQLLLKSWTWEQPS